MAEFVYANVPGKINDFLNKIKDVGVPEKASSSWLKLVGFTSSNDRTLIGVFKFIGFIDDKGSPTKLWHDYRGNNSQQILALGIKQGYAELFKVYADAHQRNSEDLENFFRTKSSAGSQSISRTVRTFQILCGFADFTGEVSTRAKSEKTLKPTQKKTENHQQPHVGIAPQISPSLHIDVQIHISPDASAEQIDQIFASMEKHLFKNRE